MNQPPNTFRTEPDERGNIFHIESSHPVGLRIVRECVAWYWSQPHHDKMSEPEHDKQIWISTVEVPAGADRCWRYLSEQRIVLPVRS
jgi:hypothetical protein